MKIDAKGHWFPKRDGKRVWMDPHHLILPLFGLGLDWVVQAQPQRR